MAKAKLPRGIDEPKPGAYRVRLYYEGRQYVIGTYDTVTNAKAALTLAKSEKVRGTFVPPSVRRATAKAAAEAEIEAERVEAELAVTVRDWSARWLGALADAGRSPGTTASYRSTLNVHILGVLGDQRLIDVSSDDVDDLMAGVRSRKGPVANVGRTLRAMFLAAVKAEVGGLTESPVRVSLPKPRRAASLAPDEIPTGGQVRALAAAMPTELAASVELAAWCALRLGEVLGLQRRDLELDDATRAMVHIRRQWNTKANPPAYGPPKRGSRRSIAIPPGGLVDRLKKHLAEHVGPSPQAPVFASPRDPLHPVSQTRFDQAWRTARASVGVSFRFHDLRHRALTEYAQKGATLAELMHRGGHTDPATVMIYQTATAERDRALTAMIDVDGA